MPPRRVSCVLTQRHARMLKRGSVSFAPNSESCSACSPSTRPSAIPSAQPTASSSYVGPLTGVDEARLDGRRFDPVVYIRDLYAAAPRLLRFDAKTREDAEAWQRELRAKLRELLGMFPFDSPERDPERAAHRVIVLRRSADRCRRGATRRPPFRSSRVHSRPLCRRAASPAF